MVGGLFHSLIGTDNPAGFAGVNGAARNTQGCRNNNRPDGIIRRIGPSNATGATQDSECVGVIVIRSQDVGEGDDIGMKAAGPVWSRSLGEFEGAAAPGFRNSDCCAVNGNSRAAIDDGSATLAIGKVNNNRIVKDYVRITTNWISIFDVGSKSNGAIGGAVKQDGASGGLVGIINQKRVNVRESRVKGIRGSVPFECGTSTTVLPHEADRISARCVYYYGADVIKSGRRGRGWDLAAVQEPKHLAQAIEGILRYAKLETIVTTHYHVVDAASWEVDVAKKLDGGV